MVPPELEMPGAPVYTTARSNRTGVPGCCRQTPGEGARDSTWTGLSAMSVAALSWRQSRSNQRRSVRQQRVQGCRRNGRCTICWCLLVFFGGWGEEWSHPRCLQMITQNHDSRCVPAQQILLPNGFVTPQGWQDQSVDVSQGLQVFPHKVWTCTFHRFARGFK